MPFAKCLITLVGALFQDFYKILGVNYDATDDSIRSNYLRLALVSTAACNSCHLQSRMFYVAIYEVLYFELQTTSYCKALVLSQFCLVVIYRLVPSEVASGQTYW